MENGGIEHGVMAQITPPVGFNLFVLQGMTKKEITYIARVTLPHFLLMCGMVLALWFFPGIATWLPGQIQLTATAFMMAAP